MPELPEVESVRRYLEALLMGKQIHRVEVHYSKIIQNQETNNFIQQLENQFILGIMRRGKYLIFELTDYFLLSHLRMEGRYLYHPHRAAKKHEHIVFHLGDNDLVYQDTRKFGTMHLFAKPIDVLHALPLRLMGLEPFSEDLTVAYLKKQLQSKKQAIKASLLDQSIVCGLGNIYVDEVLFDAHLSPTLASNQLTLLQLKQLIQSIQKILTQAIALGGTTIRTFAVDHDIHGRFQNELQIHHQATCPICKNPVYKCKVAGRTTYSCRSCQSIDKS